MKSIIVAGLFIISPVVLTGCSSEKNCKQIVQAKCVQCHSLSKTCNQTGKSKQYWKSTIDHMIRLKATVTDNERNKIVKCLAGTASFNAVCNVQKVKH